MRKMIEVEYVGIEDVQGIIDDAYAVMREGHYVGISFRNFAGDSRLDIQIMLGGWNRENEYDYDFSFYLDDEEESVSSMNDCKNVLKNLLLEDEKNETV